MKPSACEDSSGVGRGVCVKGTPPERVPAAAAVVPAVVPVVVPEKFEKKVQKFEEKIKEKDAIVDALKGVYEGRGPAEGRAVRLRRLAGGEDDVARRVDRVDAQRDAALALGRQVGLFRAGAAHNL